MDEPVYKSPDPETAKDLDKYERTKYDSLIKQVDAEYNLCWSGQYDKVQANLTRLKLYNNQRKDKDAVGDLTMFTTHQTVLASLYEDVLSSKFAGRERGDEDKGNNLDALSQFDYTKMEKYILDYMWDWDALFFGRGLVEISDFNRDKEFLCPEPEVLDPMTFLHDPKANSVNGVMKGHGRMRFGGRELWLDKKEINERNGYMDYRWLRSENELKSLIAKAQEAREDAQALQNVFNKDMEKDLGDNAVCLGLKWYTMWKGKRVMVVLANGRRRLIKYVELEGQKTWPVVDRPMFPHSHDWYGTSIPDLTEDKQRQKSVAINLANQAMKSDLYPHYIYDEDRVKNKSDLMDFGFNKFTGIKGGDGKDIRGAVQPLNKANINWAMVNFVLNTMDSSVQKATATPDMQTGSIEDQKRTLGELNLVSSNVGVRNSLAAKVFGWSEKAFWEQWYMRYDENFVGEVDEKIVRITGVQGWSYRPLMRDDFIMGLAPDIEIESKAVSEAKQMRERVMAQSFAQFALQDPTVNRRFLLKDLARLNGKKKDEIDFLFPPTVDELLARKENEALSKNTLQPVNPNDDHNSHLMEHQRAEETPAKKAHIEAHIEALRIQRDQPELFPQLQQQQVQDQELAANAGKSGGGVGGVAQMLPQAQPGPGVAPTTQ